MHVNLLYHKTTPNSQFKSDLLMLLAYFVHRKPMELNSMGVNVIKENGAKYIKRYLVLL